MRYHALAALLLALLLIIIAPLVGLALAGRPLAPFLHFPPRAAPIFQAPFDWIVFAVFSLPTLGAIVLYAAALDRTRTLPAPQARARFPAWGWLGLAQIALAWALAWSGGTVPSAWRGCVFTLLWLGYILVVNALALRRSGFSPLTHLARLFLWLFPLSAGFWWLFEYLNQYVHNWYYTGVSAESSWDYFARATLPFSTVLPAVASTWAWLAGSPRLDAAKLPPIKGHRAMAWTALAVGITSLAAIGIRADLLFPMLWVAPLLILAALTQLLVGDTVFSPIARGDWRPVLQSALAALVCGFFWELWNWGSIAKWHYALPYVERFRLFEMPLLGYAGYLPFGITCALVIELASRIVDERPLWPLRV